MRTAAALPTPSDATFVEERSAEPPMRRPLRAAAATADVPVKAGEGGAAAAAAAYRRCAISAAARIGLFGDSFGARA